ncbi:MAG: tetratricopeptide repeat protein [Endomicrobiaceae bacterium]|nr:tetratricopeptide repeat protein [Endomicrobiaceae bacterium]
MKKIMILFLAVVFVFTGKLFAEQPKFEFDQKGLEKAYKLVDQKQYKKALTVLEKLVPFDEDSINEAQKIDKIVLSDVYFNMGFCFEKLGDDANMLEFYNKALNVFPEHQATLYDLAKHYKDRNEDDMAIPLLEKLININATHDWAMLMLGDIYDTKGDFTKAKDYYKEAVRLGNEEAEMKLNKESVPQQ